MNPRDLNILALFRDQYIADDPGDRRAVPHQSDYWEHKDLLRGLPEYDHGVWVYLG